MTGGRRTDRGAVAVCGRATVRRAAVRRTVVRRAAAVGATLAAAVLPIGLGTVPPAPAVGTATADGGATAGQATAGDAGTAGDAASVGDAGTAGDAAAAWVWPTASRVVLRPFVAPASDYGAGHRGVDVEGVVGVPVVAPAAGTVTFAGPVGGRSVVTIDHGDGLVSTLDSVTPVVAVGQVVSRAQVVGRAAAGHCPASAPCLHLGARVEGRYVDPMRFLSAPEWPVLLPLG